MSLHTQAARGLKWQAIEIAGRQGISLVVFTTLARLLDPPAFGLIGLVGVYLAFVQMLAEQGMSAAVIQRKELDSRHLHAAFWFNLSCATALCGITIVLAGWVAKWFGEPQLVPLLRWASLSLIISAFSSIQGAMFAREMDFRRPAIRTFIANLVGGCVGVGMALNGFGVWSLIGQQLAAAIAGTAFICIASAWRPKLTFSFLHLRQLMAMSGSVFATSLLWFFSTRTDQLILGRMFGAPALGQYAVATRLSDLTKTVLYQPMGAVALPALSRLQGNREKLRVAIARAMEMNALISFPCLLGLSAIATEFVPLLLGPQWEPAGKVLQILALYVLANGLQGVFHYAILATGGPGIFLAISALHAAGVVLACLFGARFGATGVAMALLVNELVMNIPRLTALYRRVGVSPWDYYRPCVIPALAGAVMYAVVLLAKNVIDLHTWLGLVVTAAAAAMLYCALMLILGRSIVHRLTSLIAAAIARTPTAQMPT